MAFIVENEWNERSEKAGFRFEEEILDSLRVNLPADYGVLHSAIVSFRGPGRFAGPPRPREVDFLVAGPNGLFLLEAKYVGAVRGSFTGVWAFARKDGPAKLAETSSGERYAVKLKGNVEAAQSRVYDRGGSRLDAFKVARGIFVFPDGADINIYDQDGASRRDFHQNYHVRNFSQLAESITTFEPQHAPGSWFKAPDLAAVRAVLALFEPGMRLDPKISGDYEILHRESVQLAPNGLPYAVCKVRHKSIGYVRRGKWYDMTALAEKDRRLFEAQVRRHAQVLDAAGGHPNVNRYYEFITDLVGHGFWVIEQFIDGVSLESAFADGDFAVADPLHFMRQIAEGLRAIHAGGFVCRNLCPGSVLLDGTDRRPVLTNFEMAKAADGGPTVSAGQELADDPYRAPEVRVRSSGGAGGADIRADLYSWGAIFFRLVVGRDFDGPSALAHLEGTGLPAHAAGLVKRCLSPLRSQRPESVDELLRDLDLGR